MFLEYFCS